MAIFDDVVCDSSLNKKELYCQGGVQREYSFDRAACESEKLRKKELREIMFQRGLGQCGKSEKRALRQKWVSGATIGSLIMHECPGTGLGRCAKRSMVQKKNSTYFG